MFRSGGDTQCVGAMDGSPAAAVVATARPRVGGEKGEGSGIPERRRQSSSSWRLPRAATPSPRASTPTPRAAAPSPRASPASRACGVGDGASCLVAGGFQFGPQEVGICSGPRIEGANPIRVHFHSGPGLTEQQIRCRPRIKTGHCKPLD
jgi:hypothetical protein